jgi:hypothetical protein
MEQTSRRSQRCHPQRRPSPLGIPVLQAQARQRPRNTRHSLPLRNRHRQKALLRLLHLRPRHTTLRQTLSIRPKGLRRRRPLRQRGLRGSIVRSGYITGDKTSGVTNTDDFLTRMILGCIQLGCRPKINNTVNMVPVNHVARIVVAAAFHPAKTPLGVAQVTSRPRLTFSEYLAAVQAYGYDIPEVEYTVWSKKLQGYAAANDGRKQHAL